MADVWSVQEGGYPGWSIQRGVHFCLHFQGGPLPCSLPGGILAGPSRGAHFHVHFWGVHFCVHFQGVHFCDHFRGSTSMFTSRGVHFRVHFWGVPCDLSHNALIYCYRIYCYRMPQYIIGKIHMGTPPKS